MILRGWHIDGFGTWRDHRIDDLSPGLNLLHGPNEIGKTTLQDFVRGVLYGFPDRRARSGHHEPVHGGDHGGRLFLETEEGPVVVARRARERTPRIEGAAGERLDPHLLRVILRGSDAALFRNVFAFGLDELKSLDTLASDEVGVRIFDAGLEGAGQSVSAFLAELRKRKEAEHRGRSGRIRELAAALLEARRAESEAVGRSVSHREKLLAEEESRVQLARLRADLERERERLRQQELLLSLWPVELQRREAASALAGLGDPGVFAPRLEALLGERALQADRRRRIETLAAALGERRAEVATALASLGTGWSEERLLALDRSAARRAALARCRDAILRAENEVAEAAAARERAEIELARIDAEREALAGAPPEQVIDERELQRRRELLAEWRFAAAEADALRRRIDELRDREGGRPALGRGAWAVAILFLLGAGAALGLGAGPAAGVALLAAAFAAVLALSLRADRRVSERIAVAEEELRGRLATVERASRHFDGEGPAAIERAANLLDRLERLLCEQEERKRHLEALEARRAGGRAAREEAAARQSLASSRLREAQRVWEEATRDFGEVSVAGAEAFWERLDRIAEQIARRIADEAALRELQEAVLRWERQVDALLAEAGIQERGEAGLAGLAERIRRADELRACERRIAERLGDGEAAEVLRAALRGGAREDWEAERARAAERIATLEGAIGAAMERLALQRREREELEASADVATCAAQVAGLEAELADSVHRFRVAALLERLVEESLERFQQERQPAVLRHAGAAFARITAGRYQAVRQPAGSGEVEVVDRAGRALAAGQLSRGAREQLYLCVRLGLVRAFAERGLRLPVLLDDALVDFDPERADAAAAVLADFAAEHQVLLFTCHPATVERFVRVAPGCRVVDLAAMRSAGAERGAA